MAGTKKIVTFISEDFGKESEEFRVSFELLIQRTICQEYKVENDLTKSDFLIILDLGKSDLDKSVGQNKFIEILINSDASQLPYVLIFGAERKGLEIFNSEKYGKFSSIQLFTELCPEYYQYIPIPFEINEVISLFIKAKMDNLFEEFKKTHPSPFKCFKNTLTKINEVFPQWHNGKEEEIFKEAGECCLEEYRKGEMRKMGHGTEGEEKIKKEDLIVQIFELLIAYILMNKRSKEQNWVLIEDKLEGPIYGKNLKKTLALFNKVYKMIKFWYWGTDKFKDLKKSLEEELTELEKEGGKKTKEIRIKPVSILNNSEFDKKYNDIDCFLVDILLEGEKSGKFYDGLEFLNLLTNTHPEIPTLILSKSDEGADIKYAFERGASYYILKRKTLTLPYYYYQYLDELGKVITLIQNEKFRKNLLGNIRYWHFKKDLLWFGNKCYHIVDHSFNHTRNVWELANQLLYSRLVKIGANDLKFEDLYAFCMAIWLHDIGYKGNNKYGDPHEIRVAHPLISAELILQNPEHYGILTNSDENKDRDVKRRYSNITLTKEKSGISWIRDTLRLKEITILEKIALLCAYHQRNCPITNDEVRTLEKIPIDFYEDGDRDKKPITLESIIEDKNFLILAVLLRFIDGLDINKNRVGDINEREARKKVIEKDLEFNLLRLEKEVERISATSPMEKGKGETFTNLFYERVRDEIRTNQNISKETKQEQSYFLHSLPFRPKLENYELLKDHCLYLSVQEGHFDLHSSIDRVEIVHKPGFSNKIEIHYYSNKTKEDLLMSGKYKVKEYFEKEAKSIAAHLLGYEITSGKREDGYVIKKLSLNKKLLEKWFLLEDNDIVLHTADNKELRKEDVSKYEQEHRKNE